ncbi:MAG: hypothetical protein GY859_20000, partial [Desulfobacterales bacterium]|nr:hypothetical protein [Desulfobacterales bacterium]
NVNMPAYTAWYDSDPFIGNQPPDTPAGSTGGTCESAWAEECVGADCGSSGGGSGGGGVVCNPSTALACQFAGGEWDPVACTCSTGGGTTGGATGGSSDGNVSVSITNPSHNQTVSGTIVFRSSSLSENESVTIVSVQYEVDGAAIGPPVTVHPFSLSFDTTTLADGGHSLTAMAVDSAGESATSETYTFVVSNNYSASDSQPPSVAVTSPTDGDALTGQVILMADASDNIAVTGVQFKVDGLDSGAKDVSSPYRVGLDTTSLYDGSHTITAVAEDAAGNTAVSSPVTVEVNNAGEDESGMLPAETFPFSRVHLVPISGIITPNPALALPPGLQGAYNCYAAYASDGEIYLAETDFSGEIVFRGHREGDPVQSYETRVFSGESSWTCDAFDALGPMNIAAIHDHGMAFLIAAAPENGGAPMGALFSYTAEPPGCSVPPGHPDYCKQCGPCAEGEGHCDPGQCAPGLVCSNGVGVYHGWAPDIDVCEQPPPNDGAANQTLPAEVLPASRVHLVEAVGEITLDPALQFSEPLHGVYNGYAAYSIDGDIYLAEVDFNGNVVFQKFREGDAIKSFERREFSGESSWACDAFDNIGPIDVNDVEDHAMVFFIAAAPENDGAPEGAFFTFTGGDASRSPAPSANRPPEADFSLFTKGRL